MLTSITINIIPIKVNYIYNLFTYNKEFKVLIYTSYYFAIKKYNIKAHININYINYNNIKTITTILEISKGLKIKNLIDI